MLPTSPPPAKTTAKPLSPPKPSKFKPVKTVFIILALLVLGFFAWKFFKPEQKKPQYITAPVSMDDIEETVLATGLLQPEQLVSVGAQVSGQVKTMHVKLGDFVKQGQLIAQIDSVRQSNDLQNQQAALNNLLAQKATKIAGLKQSQLAFKRQQQMLAQDATSRAEYEIAEANYQTAQANIKAIDAQIEQSRLTISTARENVGYTRISAPIDGTVVAIVTEQGQTVNANQSAPTIVKLAKLQTMTIKAQVSEADVMRIHQGQTVYFTTLGEPDKKIYATLRAIEPAPDSVATDSSNGSNSASSSNNAVYYNALFDVPNSDGRLRINMTAQVYIVLAEAKNVLTIPSAALSTGGSKGSKRNRKSADSSAGSDKNSSADTPQSNTAKPAKMATSNIANRRAVVRVLDQNGDAQNRDVRVGMNNRIIAEIKSGLKVGEEVVIADSSDTSNEGAKRAGNRGSMRY